MPAKKTSSQADNPTPIKKKLIKKKRVKPIKHDPTQLKMTSFYKPDVVKAAAKTNEGAGCSKDIENDSDDRCESVGHGKVISVEEKKNQINNSDAAESDVSEKEIDKTDSEQEPESATSSERSDSEKEDTEKKNASSDTDTSRSTTDTVDARSDSDTSGSTSDGNESKSDTDNSESGPSDVDTGTNAATQKPETDSPSSPPTTNKEKTEEADSRAEGDGRDNDSRDDRFSGTKGDLRNMPPLKEGEVCFEQRRVAHDKLDMREKSIPV